MVGLGARLHRSSSGVHPHGHLDSSGTDSTVVTTVIYDPSAPPPPNGVGALSSCGSSSPRRHRGDAGHATARGGHRGRVEQHRHSDFSSVTLVASGPGSFSSTCSGVESYGIVQFSDCSLNAAGTYTIKAVDSNPGVGATSPLTVTRLRPAGQAGLQSGRVRRGVDQATWADHGPRGRAFGNPTSAPETVTLSSTPGNDVFPVTQGAAVTSVTIPGGASSELLLRRHPCRIPHDHRQLPAWRPARRPRPSRREHPASSSSRPAPSRRCLEPAAQCFVHGGGGGHLWQPDIQTGVTITVKLASNSTGK